MKAEITLSCISFQQCLRLCDSPDVNGNTEHPSARSCCGPPAPSGTVPWLVGSRRLQLHLSMLCFTSPWVMPSHTLTQSHMQVNLHQKHSEEKQWPLWSSAAACARPSMLLLGSPAGLQPGSELRKHQPCFGTKLLSILFRLAVELVAPGLIYCILAKPCSQMLTS